MKLANGIILEDGRRLDEVIDSLENNKSINGESVDLSVYAKETEIIEIKSEVDDLKAKVEGIVVPNISGLAKESELSDYIKSAEVDSKIINIKDTLEIEIEAIKSSIPSLDGYAKTADVSALANSLQQLISDIQAGKYNVSGTSTTPQ